MSAITITPTISIACNYMPHSFSIICISGLYKVLILFQLYARGVRYGYYVL